MAVLSPWQKKGSRLSPEMFLPVAKRGGADRSGRQTQAERIALKDRFLGNWQLTGGVVLTDPGTV